MKTSVSGSSGSFKRRGRWRLWLMLPAGICLLAGLDAALLLLGVPAPIPASSWAQAHGIIMVYGFVGALICLERAVSWGKPIGYVSPVLLVLGSAAQLLRIPHWVAGLLLLLGMAGMFAIYWPLWRRQRAQAVLIQMLGACAGLAGVILWTGGVPISFLLPWLTAFMVCTIAGERVELARVQLSKRAESQAVIIAFCLIMAACASTLFVQVGTVLFGLTLSAQVIWLGLFDVARRTVRAKGATRYMAACLLAGYFWLLIAAMTWMLGYPSSSAAYDAVIHSVFLGFVISMIMAHAPTILPAVLAVDLPYRPAMWLPVVVLHLGLVVRIWIGDGFDSELAWQIGGVVNVIALLMFVLVAVGSCGASLIEARRKKVLAP